MKINKQISMLTNIRKDDPDPGVLKKKNLGSRERESTDSKRRIGEDYDVSTINKQSLGFRV